MATRVASTHLLTEITYEWVGLLMNVRTHNGILHRDCKLVEIVLSGISLDDKVLDYYFGSLEDRVKAKMEEKRKSIKIKDGKHYNNLKSKVESDLKLERLSQRNNKMVDRLIFKKNQGHFILSKTDGGESECELLILG